MGMLVSLINSLALPRFGGAFCFERIDGATEKVGHGESVRWKLAPRERDLL